MSEKDVQNTINSFAVGISRELGVISSDTKATRNAVAEIRSEQKAMWKVIDGQNKKIKELEDGKIRDLEDARLVRDTRSGVIAAIVSFVFMLIGFLLSHAKKILALLV